MFLRRAKSRERDLERELHADLELEAEEQHANGISEEEARFAARRAFGNIAYTKEEVRRMWGWNWVDVLGRDLRYAARSLRKTPGFAATAILTLALGIGASTAMFTVVDSVLLKPLAYRDSGALVAAWERPRQIGFDEVGPNPKHVVEWQKRATAFSGLTFLRYMTMGVTLNTEHPRVEGVVACASNLFDVLEVEPMLGRTFLPEDAIQGHNVAIVTYGLWQTLLQGDPGIVGRTIRLDDSPRQIVGVLPANFHFPNSNSLRATRSRQPVSGALEPAIFFPPDFDVKRWEWNGNYGNFITIGRLKPGMNAGRAETQLAAIHTQILQEMPANQADRRPGSMLISLQPLQEVVVGESKQGLNLLMAAVLGLMLIACLNLANARVGRGLARQRDGAVRAAMGAAKWRLIWSALAEDLLLAGMGGAGGIALAWIALDVLRRKSPVDLPRLQEIHLNGSVLFFAVGLMLAAIVLSGLAPAVRNAASDPHAPLQQGSGRALGSRHTSRIQAWLIGLQVFGCTALLLVTGLFAKSLLHLLQQDKGFETGRIAVAEVRLNFQGYMDDQRRANFDDGVLANLRAIPGARSAAMVSAMPLEGNSWIEFAQRLDKPHLETPLINFRWVSPGYFETTGQRLVAGRFLDEHDLHGVVLSEGEARALWKDQSAIGGQVKIEGRIFTVVGVVADSRNTSLKSPPPPMAYVHYRDKPPFPTYFLVRSAGSVDSVISSMRQAIWKYDPNVTIARVKTLDAQLNDSLSTERFQTSVLISFGTAALLLAMLGIYGVLNYSVISRKQEIGVRMALGASRRSVYMLTLGETGPPIFVGLAAGMLATIASSRAIQSLLYGVQGVDVSIVLMVSALFLVAAGVAAFLPARRAASIDPMDALRSE